MKNFRFGCDLADVGHRIDVRKNERKNHWLL